MPESTDQPVVAQPDDSRFTFGLAVDVAAVCVEHGYPKFDGGQLVDLQEALYGVLYSASTRC